MTATPFGDMADTLLSDVEPWVLRRYGVIVLAGAVDMNRETQDKLREYVDSGGQLAITAENARGLISGIGAPKRISPGGLVEWADGTSDTEGLSFDLHSVVLPEGAQVLAQCGGAPAVVRITSGKGSYTLLLSPYGLNAEPIIDTPIESTFDAPLPSPYTMLSQLAGP